MSLIVLPCPIVFIIELGVGQYTFPVLLSILQRALIHVSGSSPNKLAVTSNLVVLEFALVYAFVRELENAVTVAHVVPPAASILRPVGVSQNTVVRVPFVELVMTYVLRATCPGERAFAVSLVSKPLAVVLSPIFVFVNFVHNCQAFLRCLLVTFLNLNCFH